MADRPDQRRTDREVLARWRWVAYIVLLTLVLLLVESTRAMRATGPQMPVQHAAVKPR